jgi:hypothetical protein
MKRLIPFVLLLLFLVACTDEFPPNPPPPGEQDLAGRAVGGIPISPGSLPKWAAEIKNTDITPTQVKAGDSVVVTVTKPASVKTKFYVHAISYAYNKKFKFWEKVFADISKSGKIVKNWAEDKATFNVPISTDRFLPGANYVVIYWCIDTEKRDDKGFKIWDCQGNKWQLGAFEMLGGSYPDILIERDIENNRYRSSTKTDGALGALYTANYETLTGVKVDVSVLQLKSVDSFKSDLAKNLAAIEPQWSKRGNVCGFLDSPGGKTLFSWLSGGNWVTVTTYASVVDDAKIGVYGIKYPSDCDLLNKLKGSAPVTNLCGNNKVDSPEDCDGTDDSACPGACRPDCSCMATGDANFGFCGDNIIEKPNKDGVTEDCEPPGARDPVTGQLISSACFLRNALGQITGTGACDDKCKCVAGAFTKSACGDGKADAGEQCGDPGTAGCAAGNMCVNCKCWAVPLTCGNGVKDAGEQCDPGKPGVACPAGQTCSGNCLCVKKAKCGNGKVEAGEQCEKASDCPNGLPGTFKACLACGCAYFGWPMGGCGDGDVDKAAGEECETDKDCANPVGGIVSPTCNKNTCKCNKVCGDGKISDPNDEVPPKSEKCDPPGKPGPCPPIRTADGGCAIALCKDDCTCPAGQPCDQPVAGCGDGKVTPPEQCEKPGDPCGCAIGADGAIYCMLCSNECQCGPLKSNSGCPGKDCGPVNGITMGEGAGQSGTGTFYTLGTRYPTFDNPNAVAADGSFKGTQCGDVCVSSVVKFGAVDTDGSDVTKDGACYYVSARSAISGIGPVVVGQPTPQPSVASYYTISGITSKCSGTSQISEPVVEGDKCTAKTMSCPSGTECKSTSTGAACVSLPTCTDTDGGKSYTVKGSVRYTNNPYGVGEEFDICDVNNVLVERVCNSQTEYTRNWERYTCPGSCSNGACVGAPGTLASSTSAVVVQGTSGCNTNTNAGCVVYYDSGFTLRQVCNQCSGGCCVSYSCGGGNQVVKTTTPAGCNAGTSLSGGAVFTGDISDIASSKGTQIALFLVAAMGILAITLLNFIHKK